MQHLQQKLATFLGDGLKASRHMIATGGKTSPSFLQRMKTNIKGHEGKWLHNVKNNEKGIENRVQKFYPKLNSQVIPDPF